MRSFATEGLMRLLGIPARDALAELAIEAPDPSIRRLALTRVDNPEIVRKALHDRDASVRVAATRAVGVLGDAGAANQIIAALADLDETVRIAAIQTFSVINPSCGQMRIAALLNDSKPAIRREAATGLGRMAGSPPCRTALLRRLQHDSDESVKAAAAYALGKRETVGEEKPPSRLRWWSR